MKNLHIGLDIGGSKTKSVLIKNLRPLKFFEIRYDDRKPSSDEMKEIIIRAINNLGVKLEDIGSIGVAVPSVVVDGEPCNLHINPALRKFKISKFLNQKYNVPIFIENDVNLAALAEWVLGHQCRSRSLFLINLATGCGSGFIKNGQLYRGHRSSAFEFGHIKMGVRNNFKCPCGGQDHIESYLSSQFFKTHGLDTFEEIKKANEGNKKSLKLFDEYGYYLGLAVSMIVNLLEPEIIVITGGLIKGSDLFLKRANKVCHDNIFIKKIRLSFKIKPARMGEDATVLGAALWATNKYN